MGTGGFTDDFTQTANAGGSPHPQLCADDGGLLRPLSRRFRQTLQQAARPFAEARFCHASAGRRRQPCGYPKAAGTLGRENHGPLSARKRCRHSFHQKPAGNAGLTRSGAGRERHSTEAMIEHRPEVADVFRTYEKDFFARWGHVLSPQQRKAFEAIRDCRTAALGGHVEYVEQCDTCGHLVNAYNSCRDRHCPKCQALAREKWLAARETELLPVPYFHVVFTLPQQIGALALQNAREIYNILFRAAAETLFTIAADPKRLGAAVGFLAVLHTWGQNLHLHPHLHCVVPGGGIGPDGAKWIACRKPSFLLPIAVLRSRFRNVFLIYLREAFEQGRLKFHGEMATLGKPPWFAARSEEHTSELQ